MVSSLVRAPESLCGGGVRLEAVLEAVHITHCMAHPGASRAACLLWALFSSWDVSAQIQSLAGLSSGPAWFVREAGMKKGSWPLPSAL